MYNTLITKIYNMIKQAVLSLPNGDISAYPNAQATFNKKATKFTRMSVYGICSNPPVGSHVLLLNGQGQESNKFGFINDFLNRKKALLPGEACLYNTLTKSYVLLKSDGSVEIFSASGVINFLNDLSVVGSITATGTITATTDVVVGGISLKTHTHGGVEPGAGNTGVPQ